MKRSGPNPLARATAQLTLSAGVARYVWTHPSNSGQRLRALARAAGYQARTRLLRRRVLARLGERSRLWVAPHRTAASMALYANPPDLPEMLAWRHALRGGGLFVDVGANVGTYTLWAAEYGAEVIALEPAADTFRLLQENIALNGYPVTAVQAAAGDHCGRAGFTAGLDAGNSLAPDGPAVTDLVTIDSLIGGRRVAGMKIDVEGFEIDVLRGAARALADHRIGLIQIEWNQASTFAVGADRRPVAELLAGHGYRLSRPDETGRLTPVGHPGFGSDVFASPEPRPLAMSIPPVSTAPASSAPAPARRPASRSHRTPRYLYHRTRQLLFERAHPGAPWLTPAAVELLGTLLRPTDRGAEFGSGRSTLWFAARVAALTSVEHDPGWHESVAARLKERGIGNVDCILAPGDQPVERGGESAYARTALSFPDVSLDFTLIDGHYRDYSAKFILPKIKPGGMLIIDNVNWYLPCRSKAPNSRTPRLGPATETWAAVWQQLATWRTIWTSSGVWDTAIFIRPAD